VLRARSLMLLNSRWKTQRIIYIRCLPITLGNLSFDATLSYNEIVGSLFHLELTRSSTRKCGNLLFVLICCEKAPNFRLFSSVMCIFYLPITNFSKTMGSFQ
jgi:hypothetical protein